MAPCRFFARGNCARGKACRFEHEVAADADASNLRADAPTFSPSFKREYPPAIPPAPQKIQPDHTEASTSFCRFFAQGSCKYGDTCRFRHAIPFQDSEVHGDELNDVCRATEQVAISKDSDGWSRNFGGAIVQFGLDAKITSVKLASDFSAIQISGLPSDSTAETVHTLLATFGLQLPLESVRTKHVGSTGVIADVKVEDSWFGREASLKINEQLEKGRHGGLKVCSKVVSNDLGAPANRVQNASVSCTWYKPSRVAWLHYRQLGKARQAEKSLNSNGKILGRKIACSVQMPSTFRAHPPRVYSVQIGNLNMKTTAYDLRQRLRPDLRDPTDIIIGKATYSLSDNEAADTIKTLLSQKGPLEMWEPNTTFSASKMKGMAKFHSAEDARTAVNDLSGSQVALLGNSKLFVNPLVSVKISILVDLYRVIQAEIDHLRQHIWEVDKVHVKIYESSDPSRRFVVVRLYGENAKSVSKAKSALENILAGNIILNGSKALWDNFFARPEGLVYLRGLYQQHKTFVYRDVRRSHLATYGSTEGQHTTRVALTRKVNELSKQAHKIVLTADMLTRALQGGLRRIAEVLGKRAANLDVKRKPNTITIHGSTQDLATAHLILNGADLDGITKANPNESAPECVVCWTDAEDAYRTRCGHLYCRECFASQCTSAGDGDLPIRCLGDSGKCSTVFDLDQLKDGLTGAQLEGLLERSFATFVRMNPATFHYCPTPDCPQVYRASEDGKVHDCSNCLASICTTCHVVNHDGLSCAEYKDLSSEGAQAFAKWKIENNVKECPKCKTAIEKSYGCNHMECLNCHIHFCWFCLDFYDTGNEVYRHMLERHQSYVE